MARRKPSSAVAGGRTGNELLDRLLLLDDRLSAAQTVSVHAGGHEHLRPGDQTHMLYFPVGSVVSRVVRMRSGEQAEVMTVGLDGFVGLHALLGVTRSPNFVVQHIAGEVISLPAALVQRAQREVPEVGDLIALYAGYKLRIAHQLAACNAVHHLAARTARWILATADRLGTAQYPLTQDLLAQLLAVSRPFLNQITKHYKERGLIDYGRGMMRILDRAALEREACECYGFGARHYDDLLGRLPLKGGRASRHASTR